MAVPPPNNRMKGLLKGLRYISQIFENEKEREMQIGLPTDVKHVAHIGWDGPSVNSKPSWMNEFKGQPGHRSAPLVPGAGGEFRDEDAAEWVSKESRCKKAREPNCPARDMPELPKSSRRSSSSAGEVAAREKSDKAKQPRRSSRSKEKDSEGSARQRKPKDPSQISDPSENRHRSRRKTSKDGGSSRRAGQGESDNMSESGSVRPLYQPSSVDFEEEERRLSGVL